MKKYIFYTSQVTEDFNTDPDPLVRGTDPRIRIRIRTKMSRIRWRTRSHPCTRTRHLHTKRQHSYQPALFAICIMKVTKKGELAD
jgi:hypothetical protein